MPCENVESSLYKQSSLMLRSQSWPRLEPQLDSEDSNNTILVTEPSHHVRRGPASVLVSQRNGIFYSLDEGGPPPRSERGATGWLDIVANNELGNWVDRVG